MERKLSQTKIESFSGDVLPLILIGEEKFSTEDIRWSCEGDCLQIVSFENSPTDPFTNGVLLTLLSPGEATVKATFENRDYLCRVIVRERVHTPSGRMNYYIGDFHDHTHKSHKKDIVTARDTMLPGDYIRYVKEEGKMDSGVISDHGSVLNYREFFRGFWDALEEEDPNLLIFPGCESEITAVEYDRYEMPHKNSGEIVTLMASAYASVRSWNDFLKNFENSPFAVAILAHPQISGFSVPGIWNFSLHKNNSPRFRQMLKMVEMGDGSDRQSNLINEYIYSVALDQGFRVSTTCSSVTVSSCFASSSAVVSSPDTAWPSQNSSCRPCSSSVLR